MTDISDRAQSLNEVASFFRAVSLALVQATSLPQMLQACADAMVEHLSGAFARIWTLEDGADVLILQASAGVYTHVVGPYSRIRVGQYTIGRIAHDRTPHLTNALADEHAASTHPEWPERETMAAMAGYPLVVEDRLVGVMAMFARNPLSSATLDALGTVAHGIAGAIQRKRADAAASVLAAIVEGSDDAVVSSTLEGTITSFNRGAERLYGYTARDVVGQPVSILYPHGHTADIASLRERVVRGEHVSAAEVARRRKDGALVTVALTVSPIRDARGTVIGVSGISRDISERKLMEEHLRQAQKMEAVGRLAGGVAHDFNNLLTVINGNTEVLLDMLRGQEKALAMLRDVRQAGERAATLTHQLLAYSRKQMLQPKVLNLNAVVADTQEMLARILGEDLELTVTLDPEVRQVKADAGQLVQVLMNLCLNARDAMPTGGVIAIHTRNATLDGTEFSRLAEPPTGPYVELAVSDTGSGMDADTQKHLFEPFFTTKEQGRGTGLGLATVYGIVKQSGGYINVDSEAGRGTTFRIYLPPVDAVAEETDRVAAERSPRGTETVLVVEDEARVRALIRHLLQRKGYRVLEAEHGQHAVTLASEHAGTIDLLITDVVMPRMNGRQVAETLRQMRPTLRVLFMSGYSDDEVVRHGIAESETPFLQKPFSMADLTRKVREVLDRAV